MLVYGINVKQSIGASVNLSLHNFASNSKILLEAMPIEDRAKYLKDLDLRHDALLVQSLIYYYGMFQNRQSTHRRNEQLKQTSFFSSRTDLFSTKESARSKRSTPQNRLYRWNKTPRFCAQEESQSVVWSKPPIDSLVIELINGYSSVSRQLRKCTMRHERGSKRTQTVGPNFHQILFPSYIPKFNGHRLIYYMKRA